MAKRNKAKFASKSRKSALRVEALEQRQLLATVTGSGVEVASNISLNGNVFDQVVLTGASVTVEADPGQIVRVSFLDQQGDIVQTEFSGHGKFTVSLDDLKLLNQTGYNNANPAQTYLTTVTGNDGKVHTAGSPIDYAQGLASIFIDNPEFDTNVSVFSAGLLTNYNFFNGQAKQGGNHYADIARIIIVGDPTNEAGYNNFGGIRAANAIFSADSGVVGIRAENIAVQSTVIVGDIDAKGAGVPTLVFHNLSQFQQVKVAGGDLVQSNGSVFGTSGNTIGGVGGFNSFVAVDGARSDYDVTKTIQANVDSGAFRLRSGIDQDVLALNARNQFVSMDGNWSANLAAGTLSGTVSVAGKTEAVTITYSGSGQDKLDAMFSERSFGGNLTITGTLADTFEINLGKVAGTLEFVGDVNGHLEANGLQATIGALKINGNLTGEVFVRGTDRTVNGLNGFDSFQNKIGSVTITGNMGSTSASGAYILAESIGDVNITGNLTGVISTDLDLDGSWDGTQLSGTNFTDYEGAIGNVSIGGNIDNAAVIGQTGIGNINVGGNITGANPALLPGGTGIFSTNAAKNNVATGLSAANLSVGNIGTITVVGDVDLALPTGVLVNIFEEGNFGNISIQGNGMLGRVDNNDYLNVGRVLIGGGFGNQLNTTTGSITIADAKSADPRGTDINFGGVQIGTVGNATGKVGAITVTGRGEDTDFVLSGVVGAMDLGTDIVEVSSLTVTGFEDILVDNFANIQGSKIGTLTFTPINGVGSNDTNDGTGTQVATSVELKAGILANNGATNVGETIGDLTIDLKLTNSTLKLGPAFMMGTADVLKGTGSQVGNVTLTANAITGNNGSAIFAEKVGNTMLTAGSGKIDWQTAYNGLTIGNLTATAASDVSVTGNIGSSGGVVPLGLPADRTESVGNFNISSTSSSGTVTFGSNSTAITADVIGTTTLNSKDGKIDFNARLFTAADTQSTATGAYGAISLASSTKGTLNFNGSLSGAAGGNVTLTTLSSGNINIGTTYLSGAGGTLVATLADGTIAYNADLESGSIGAATLTSTTKGAINYGATSTFAGTVGDVTISTKDTGAVTYQGTFGQNIAVQQKSASVGAVTITSEKGTISITPKYDDQVSAVGLLTASSTGDAATITYGAQTLGVNGANLIGTQIDNGKQIGTLGLVTLTTAGKNASINVTADIEATEIAGLLLTTTGTTGSANISLTGATLWAQKVGVASGISGSTVEGNIAVDSATSIAGIWDSSTGATEVGNISFTASNKGTLDFDATVKATTFQTAESYTGAAFKIGNLTLSGNTVGGGVTFEGKLTTGVFSTTEVNAGKFDAPFDAGTIGQITFNGNTQLDAGAQFGTVATKSLLQTEGLQNGELQNGQLALLTSSIAGFKVVGSLTHTSGGGDTDGLIRAGSLASFEVTGATALAANASNGDTGLIFVPQLGTLTIGAAGTTTTLTAAAMGGTDNYAPVFAAHDIGGINFKSDTTNLAGGNVFIALDATSDLDTIGDITATGKIVGNNLVSNFNGTPRAEIEASKIGNVSIIATVNSSATVNTLVTDLDIRASNVRGNDVSDVDPDDTVADLAGSHAITRESISQTGSNLDSFAIGNITIIATPANNLPDSFLFDGMNSFVATGKVGDVTFTGGTSGSVQTKLFQSSGDAAWVVVGDSDSIGTSTVSPTDFNGDGVFNNTLNPGVTELTSDFTGSGAKVSIGNVAVNADNSAPTVPPEEDVDRIGGTVGSQLDGLVLLAGVQLNNGIAVPANAGKLADSVDNSIRGSRIEADLVGRVGSVFIQNGEIASEAQGGANFVNTPLLSDGAGLGAVIAVAGDGSNVAAANWEVGDIINIPNPPQAINPLSDGGGLVVSVIGDSDGGANPADLNWNQGEVLVYVL